MRLLAGVQDNIFMSEVRYPSLKVFLYDQSDDFSDIVLNKATQIPLDLTKNTVNLSLNESVDSATTLSLTIVASSLDVQERLSPYVFLGKKIIKVTYTDSRLKNRGINNPINLFIGPTMGQPGFKHIRGESFEITVKCEDRSNFYKKRNLETPKFFENTDLGEMAIEVATNGTYGFGMERDECKFGLFFSEIAHTEVSLFDVGMLEGLQLVGFIVDKMPGFDADGFLRFYDTSLEKTPARIYQDFSLFSEMTWPESDMDGINRVVVVGLSNIMTKVISDFQELATITGTIGYFQERFKTNFNFSNDGQGRAENVVISKKRFDGQIGKILKGSKAKLKEISEFGAILEVKCPYQIWVFIIFFIIFILFYVQAAIVGIFPIFGAMAIGSIYLLASIWLTLGLIMMQQMGTFEVTISGKPYKMVYEEIQGVAEWSNLKPYEVNEKLIENHFVYNQTMADALARRELIRETVKPLTRSFSIPFDPVLEVHDIIEVPDGSRFYITSLSKNFQRSDPSFMQISAFMTRSGKEHSNLTGYPEV